MIIYGKIRLQWRVIIFHVSPVSLFLPPSARDANVVSLLEILRSFFSLLARSFRACLRSLARKRKADVNDASSANLFPINTVLTSGRLGFSQKQSVKRQKNADRGSGITAEKACGTIVTVHRAHSADLWINIFRRHPAENYSRKYLDFRLIPSHQETNPPSVYEFSSCKAW